MLRNLLLSFFLLNALFVFAQNKVLQPYMNGDTLFTSSGFPIIKGSQLQLGEGTAVGGSFEYIRIGGVNWESLLYKDDQITNNKITSHMAHEKVRVIEIREFKKKKSNPEYLIKVEYGFSKYWCDIEKAIKAGEVLIKI